MYKALFSTFVFLFSFYPPLLQAQEKMIARDGFQEGFRSIQFGIGENFKLSSFGDANLSVMKYDSESTARFLRVTIFTAYNNFEQDSKDIQQRPESNNFDSQITENLVFSGISTDLRAHLGKINYLKTSSDILPFFSKSVFVGANLYTDSSNRNRTSQQNGQTHQEVETEDFRFTPELGISTSFGVEYFISKNISLHAQTGLILNYSYGNTDFQNKRTSSDNNVITEIILSERKQNVHEIELSATGVLFGISAFF